MEIIENYKDGILYYQFEGFNNMHFVNHLFTSRIGWNTKDTYDKISNIFSVPKTNIIKVKQVHGN